MPAPDLRELQSSPEAFRRHLKIDADGRVVRLADALDEWQRQDFESLDPAWRAVCGHEKAPGTRLRAYLERPRGHSKSTDISIMACYALFASKRALSGFCCAADKEQAAIIRQAIQRLAMLNPWLGKILEVQAFKVVNRHTGSELQIISSDVGSSFGILPDFVVLDELTHWPEGRGQDLFGSLLSSAAKKSNCLMLIISNAGFQQSWQWTIREQIRTDPSWIFSRLEAPVASWLSAETLAEQKRLLPSIAYSRLWLNSWSSGSGDALDPADIDSACRLTGPTGTAEKGYVYVGGLDIGLSRDAAALAVLGIHCGYSESKEIPRKLSRTELIRIETGLAEPPVPQYEETFVEGTGRLKLVDLRVWSPKDSVTGRVSLEEIEEYIAALDQKFHLRLGADPFQCEYLAQRLQKRGVPVELVPFTPLNLTAMCSTVLESFSSGLIDLFPDADLLADLRNLRVVEKSYGVRLDSPRTLRGHGDAATSLAIAAFLSKSVRTGLGTFCDSDRLICY